MKYALVIFDFDGTLADTGRWFLRTLNELAPRYGYRAIDEAEAEELRRVRNREVIRRLGVSTWRIPFIATEMRKLAAEDAETIALFDGVRELVASLLDDGMKCAIVSSNSEANVRRILGPEICGSLVFECGAGLFGKAKKFRTVMKRVGVGPAETICIGDEERDIDAAREVGAASGAVLWGYAAPELLTQCSPTLTFAEPSKILAALRGPTEVRVF